MDDSQDVILLLGDWLIDEYWAFGVHRSSTASRTGAAHLRALHGLQDTVQAFCGAGRSAYFLHQLYSRADARAPATSIVGLGFWHRADTGALCALFDPMSAPNNLYRMITRPDSSAPAGVDLINLNESYNAGKDDDVRDLYEYTTRIIRVYSTEPEHGGLEYRRLDWEPRLRQVKWTSERLARLQNEVIETLRGRTLRAVVVKDMRKAAVTPELVEWLVGFAPPTARWYLSSKEWQPKWLEKVKGVQLKLYMIPQVAAREAIRRQELSSWLVRSGKPSNEAVKLIDKAASDTKAETIFVLPDEFSALVYSKHSGVPICVVQPKSSPDPVAVDMGGASITFPALVACMEHPVVSKSWETIASVALETTHEWVNFEAQRILKPQKPWKPDHAQPGSMFELLRSAVRDEFDIGAHAFGDIAQMDWTPLSTEWEQALKTDTGVVKVNGAKELQLWRAMLEVDGYICCDDEKRKHLRKMLQGIRTFDQRPKHHASCMLVADPGTGKSFLARRLAKAVGLDFIAFNITQMQTRGDIIRCFELIAEQAHASRGKHRRLLVFMDEINALLEREKPYSTFLTPLEDGTYVHNGQIARIPPCVWIFAGTEDPGDRGKDGPEQGTKLSDFVSRLTFGIFNLGKPSDLKIAKLERVYVGVSMLKEEFSEIDFISEAVLWAFRYLPDRVRGRDIKNFVRRFRDIQYSGVTARNVPDDWADDGDAAYHWRTEQRYSDEPDIQIVAGR